MAQAKVKADVPIEALLTEKRKFPPPKAFVTNAIAHAARVGRHFCLQPGA